MLLEVERLGREAVAELHRTVGIVRSGSHSGGADLEPLPGLADLDQLGAGVRAAGVRVQGAVRPLPHGVDVVAYRVVQEALTNTPKHAGAARATVEVCYGDTDLAITVVDDGRGGRDPALPAAGHGLLGLRERAALYGGSVDASPTRNKGYEVRLTLPIPAEKAAASSHVARDKPFSATSPSADRPSLELDQADHATGGAHSWVRM